jgi:hypothetical protein
MDFDYHGALVVVETGDGSDGPEGPARAYPPDALPAIMPVRVANQRVLEAYRRQREGRG